MPKGFGPDDDDDDEEGTNGPGWDDGIEEQEDKWYDIGTDDDE